MKKMKVLVTGGAGFIGSHIVDALLAEGFDVTVLDDFSAGKMENIASHKDLRDFHVVRGDIRDASMSKRLVEDIDVVFHEAALIDVELSFREPLLFNEVNVVGTFNILNASINANVKRFIFSSSAAVYGDADPSKKREDMLPQPVSPYGISKLTAEHYVQIFNKVYGLETVSLRYFNVYGPRQGSESSYSGVITIFANRLLNDKPPIIHGDGKQTRDFIYVEDVVSANMLALERKAAIGKIFNIASGVTISINELAKMMQQITSKEYLAPIFTRSRTGDIKHCSADISMAEKHLEFCPRTNIQDGLLKFVNKYSKVNVIK